MDVSSLLNEAKRGQTQAYAPYSTKFVGAAVLWNDGTITNGCNIENASYGATVCAERVAIWKGLSENKNRKIDGILVISPSSPAWPPCGLCRQVIAEFATAQTLVHWTDGVGPINSKSLDAMLPEVFSASFLKGK